MKTNNDINKDRGAKAIVPFSSVALLRRLAHKLHQRGETDDAQDLASAIAGIVMAYGEGGASAARARASHLCT